MSIIAIPKPGIFRLIAEYRLRCYPHPQGIRLEVENPDDEPNLLMLLDQHDMLCEPIATSAALAAIDRGLSVLRKKEKE